MQKIFQFKQLERRSPENIRVSTGVEPVTSAIPCGVVGLYESVEELCHWWKYDHMNL